MNGRNKDAWLGPALSQRKHRLAAKANTDNAAGAPNLVQEYALQRCYQSSKRACEGFLAGLDSLQGSSVKIGRLQRRLAWPLRKDDTHKSRSVNNSLLGAAMAFEQHCHSPSHSKQHQTTPNHFSHTKKPRRVAQRHVEP